MVDEPKAPKDGEQPEKEEFSSVSNVRLLPESESQPQTQNTKKQRQYRQNVVWLLKAIGNGAKWAIRGVWKIIKIGFQFADAHDGAITALATVAIVVLTIFYVTYSKKQWEEMRAARRPWIGMSERLVLNRPPSFSVVKLTGREDYLVNIDFELSGTLQNFGTSPARRVYEYFYPLQFGNIRYSWMNVSCAVAEAQSMQDPKKQMKATGVEMRIPARAIFPNVVVPVRNNIAHMGIFIDETHRLPDPIWILGCVAYQDSFGEVHHTKVLYSSGTTNGSEEVAIERPLLKYTPFIEFVMEDSDSD